MKKTILLLVLPFLSFSQNEKGASPLANPSRDLGPIHNPQSTRAVVIGISDYQEKDIPDLRFADKDALAFANFLRSPAGGSLDNDHLEVLTNQNATAGLVAAALDALIEQTKAGDEVTPSSVWRASSGAVGAGFSLTIWWMDFPGWPTGTAMGRFRSARSTAIWGST